jgi:hypothetical protein
MFSPLLNLEYVGIPSQTDLMSNMDITFNIITWNDADFTDSSPAITEINNVVYARAYHDDHNVAVHCELQHHN